MKISMDIICERIPDAVRIITQDQTVFMNRQGAVFTHHDVELEFILQEKILDIILQSKGTPISFFMIRWNGILKHNLKFIGDAFERAYGNLEWRGFNPQRVMPWYFLASDEMDSQCYVLLEV
jgi:alpha-galactosidase